MGWVGLGRWVGGYVVGAFSCELENDKVIGVCNDHIFLIGLERANE